MGLRTPQINQFKNDLFPPLSALTQGQPELRAQRRRRPPAAAGRLGLAAAPLPAAGRAGQLPARAERRLVAGGHHSPSPFAAGHADVHGADTARPAAATPRRLRLWPRRAAGARLGGSPSLVGQRRSRSGGGDGHQQRTERRFLHVRHVRADVM